MPFSQRKIAAHKRIYALALSSAHKKNRPRITAFSLVRGDALGPTPRKSLSCQKCVSIIRYPGKSNPLAFFARSESAAQATKQSSLVQGHKKAHHSENRSAIIRNLTPLHMPEMRGHYPVSRKIRGTLAPGSRASQFSGTTTKASSRERRRQPCMAPFQ